jgi:hypothetical protein
MGLRYASNFRHLTVAGGVESNVEVPVLFTPYIVNLIALNHQ